LANWVHSKTLTFLGVWNCKIYLCTLVDSIIPNLHLLRCLSLQKFTHIYWGIDTMKKKGVLQLALQLNDNSIKTIHFQLLCNSIINTPMMSY
jgi:hypothetical protein